MTGRRRAGGSVLVVVALLAGGCAVPCVDDGFLSMQHSKSCAQDVTTGTTDGTATTGAPTTTGESSTTNSATTTTFTTTLTTGVTASTGDTSSGSSGSGASCFDWMVNGDESDIDCGGSICAGCPVGQQCAQDHYNCLSEACNGSICVDPVACTLPPGTDLLGTKFDSLGALVAVVGDVDGDGIDDIVASAVGSSVRMFTIYGAPALADGFDLAAVEAGQGGFVTVWNQPIDAIAPAGDFNEDGVGDFALGGSGDAFVVFGRAVAPPVPKLDLDTLVATGKGARISGDSFGVALAGGLDVDGDGKRDLVIGAPGITQDNIYVVFSDKSIKDVSTADVGGAVAGFTMTSVMFSQAGTSVALLPSINGDALAEVLVGAPLAANASGRVYVVYGKADMAPIDLDTPGPGFFEIGPAAPKEQFIGQSVAAAGDVDGDGLADIVTTSPTNEVFVIFGKADDGDVDTDVLGAGGFRIVVSNGSGAPLQVGGGPDIDGDGRSEVLVGDPLNDPETLWVVLGKATTETVQTDDIEVGTGGFAIRLADPDSDFAKDFGVGDPLGIGAATAVIGAPGFQMGEGLLKLVTFGLCPQ